MAQIVPMRVFADVPQSVAGDMKKGVHAKISASNIAGRVFEGTVARTADAIDPQSRTLKVEVDIPNSDQALVPGMYVDVSFDIPTAGLPQVPAAALLFRSGGPEVAVVDNQSRIAFHKVTIIRDNGSTVGIGSGIKVGDRIALNISSQVTDGATVDARATGDDAKNAPPKNH
jgi:RND family efflux transporter MFP subunit